MLPVLLRDEELDVAVLALEAREREGFGQRFGIERDRQRARRAHQELSGVDDGDHLAGVVRHAERVGHQRLRIEARRLERFHPAAQFVAPYGGDQRAALGVRAADGKVKLFDFAGQQFFHRVGDDLREPRARSSREARVGRM